MVKFRVDGMTCGGCARAVTSALRRMDPEAAVDVDLPSKIVSIKSRMPQQQLQTAIEQAGFRVALCDAGSGPAHSAGPRDR